jgi:hypothetical protein
MRVDLRRRAGGAILNAQLLESVDVEKIRGPRFVPLENPRTFLTPIARSDWRRMPLEFVVLPTLDAPVLVFADKHSARAEYLQADIQKMDQRRRRKRATQDFRAAAAIANQIRRAHLRRVSLAIGYTWPGNPPGHIEFADG